MFRCGVGSRFRCCADAGHGADVEDHALATALHWRDLVFHPEVNTFGVNRKLLIHIGFCEFGDVRHLAPDPGIVNGDVEMAECARAGIDQLLAVRFARDVAPDRDRFPAVRVDSFGNGFQLWFLDVAEGESRAACRQLLGQQSTESLCCARDQDGFAPKVE